MGERAGATSPGWPGPGRSASSSLTIATLLAVFTLLAVKRPETPRVGVLAHPHDARRPALHIAARRRLHPPLLARLRSGRPRALVGAPCSPSSMPQRCSAGCNGDRNAAGERRRSVNVASTGWRKPNAMRQRSTEPGRDGARSGDELGAGLRGRSRRAALDRQRVPAFDPVEGRPDEGDASGSSTRRSPSPAWRSTSSPRPITTHEYEAEGPGQGLHRDHRHQGQARPDPGRRRRREDPDADAVRQEHL